MEKKLNYLNMIQNVITRMAGNSFMLKGWAVTLVSAMFVLSDQDANQLFFVIAYIPVVMFWFLDSYYLQLERKYRVLYSRAVETEEGTVDFSLVVPPSDASAKTLYHQSLLSRTEAGFYLPLAALIALVVLVISPVS